MFIKFSLIVTNDLLCFNMTYFDILNFKILILILSIGFKFVNI